MVRCRWSFLGDTLTTGTLLHCTLARKLRQLHTREKGGRETQHVCEGAPRTAFSKVLVCAKMRLVDRVQMVSDLVGGDAMERMVSFLWFAMSWVG